MESVKKVSPFGYSCNEVKYKNESLVDDEDYTDYESSNIETFETISNKNKRQHTINTHKPYMSLQHILQRIFLSNRYQVFIITLVVLDTLIVITELLLDLELSGTQSKIPEVLHCISLSLLSLFVVEIFVKLYAFRWNFFTSKGDVFDAAVVIIALILDSMSLHSEDAFGAVGLVIVLRLWRVVRIQNSMVMSVHKRGEKKLITEREVRKRLEADLETEREILAKINKYCCELILLLQRQGINPPPPPYALKDEF